MGINELSVLAMILHTCAHAAPHSLIGSGVVAIMTRTGRGEINIASVLGMLTGEDMVERGQLVVVGIAGLRITTVHIFR